MDDPLTLTINFSHPLVAGGAALLALMFLSWLVYLTLPEAKGDDGPLHKLRAALGMERLPHALILSILALYTALASILILGLFGLIVDTLHASGRSNDYLFYVLRIGGLTAVLGAVIALPLTVIRLRLTQEQTETARESLFNDKINEATKGLYARRQVTVGEGEEAKDHWESDVVQRCAAIDRLEGLAQEKPTEVPRIARLLSVYVRELSAEVPAHEQPTDASPAALWNWAVNLPRLRSDIEKAAQTIGRLAGIGPATLTNAEIDLSGANLQRADLSYSKLDSAVLKDAQMQAANLFCAQMNEADLSWAKLHSANLVEAQMIGAKLHCTVLQNAHVNRAQMQGADLHGANFEGVTFLTSANLLGAAVSEVDLTRELRFAAHIDHVFADASVTAPSGARAIDSDWPQHWAKQRLNHISFHKAWRAWQATLPPGWDQPD